MSCIPLGRKPVCLIVHEALEQMQVSSTSLRLSEAMWLHEASERLAVYQIYIFNFQRSSVNILCRICGWLTGTCEGITLLILWPSPVSIHPLILYIQIMHVSLLHRQWNCRNLKYCFVSDNIMSVPYECTW